MWPVERATGRVGALPETIAGALAYFLIPAIVFLLVEPYSRNRFVRFHSVQCIAVCIVGALLGLIVRIADIVLFFIPVAGPLLAGLIVLVAVLAWVILWLVLVVKALQGEMFELPLIGPFAARHAAAG